MIWNGVTNIHESTVTVFMMLPSASIYACSFARVRERERESSLMSLIAASCTIKCLPDKCLFFIPTKPAAMLPTKL